MQGSSGIFFPLIVLFSESNCLQVEKPWDASLENPKTRGEKMEVTKVIFQPYQLVEIQLLLR